MDLLVSDLLTLLSLVSKFFDNAFGNLIWFSVFDQCQSKVLVRNFNLSMLLLSIFEGNLSVVLSRCRHCVIIYLRILFISLLIFIYFYVFSWFILCFLKYSITIPFSCVAKNKEYNLRHFFFFMTLIYCCFVFRGITGSFESLFYLSWKDWTQSCTCRTATWWKRMRG